LLAMLHWECPRCETLLEEYREANRRLSASSKRVAEAAKSWEFEIFHEVWLEAQALHAECTRLRKEFLAHIENH
jgi:hypothetical protein